MLKLLTGSRLFLNDEEKSKDIDFKVIVESEKEYYEVKKLKTTENDIFVVIMKSSYDEVSSFEKEGLFYLVITWLLHKKLNMKIENEDYYSDFINLCVQNIKDLLNNTIGLGGRIPRIKWFWWYWCAVKFIRNEWESLTIDDIKSVFTKSRTRALTEEEIDYVDDYIVENILLGKEIIEVRGRLIPYQLEMIDAYKRRHNK